ncbi:MAG TPA: MmgE/PrpD family protein [Methylomirabilota bacterium]|jgi:2-methylcitrate dehydratase PrpD|nr:MmgE/PrpD family protein [Methylomirabilota bacterium]
MTLARRLADFAVGLRFEDIPAEVVASVRLRTLDILGLALAASTQEFAGSVAGALDGWHARGDCTVIGGARTAPPPLAILANGTLAHGLDFDDTHAPSVTHASAVVLPTVLALGEAARLDGRAVITAAVAGYEAITRIGMAASGAFHERGWHATAVCGAFAAALAAAKCEGLDVARTTAALGLAGSFSSGVMEFLEDGSWAKRVHPGWAGHSGATAAALARGGFTGPASILEGRFGFYRVFLGVDPDPAPFATLGREWETLRVGFKPYPCCHLSHAYLDCALELRGAHALAAGQIEAVECLVPKGEVPIVCEPREAKLRPRSAYDAQFSLPFSIAAALVDGRVGLDTYAPARLGDRHILDLAARVTHAIDPGSTYPAAFPGWVRLRLRDGRVLEARAPDGRGSIARPLSPEALADKFRDNAGRALPAARVAEIERAALALDALADVSALTALCRA